MDVPSAERMVSLDAIMFLNQCINCEMLMQRQEVSVVSFQPKKNNVSKCYEMGH